MAAITGALAAKAIIHVVLRGCQGRDPFQPTSNRATATKVAMYAVHSTRAAGSASRARPPSARRYAAHAVANSESRTLGSGDAWNVRPDTASIAASTMP